MSDKVLKKIVSSFLSVIIGVSSLAISPLTVSAVTSETIESTSTVQNENITVKWLYEDNPYHHGSSFAIDEKFSVTNSVGLNIAYDIQKVRDGGYEPNELVITVQGIGDIYRKSTLQANSVGADKMTATTKTHDWSYSYDGSEDIYTFTNNKKIDGNSVLNGYFDLIWNLRSTETVNDYRQDNIQATMKFSDNGIVHSNLLTLTNKTYCDTYQGWFTANRLSSSKGMNVDNPSEYIFVRYNLDCSYTSKSRTLKSPEKEIYTFDVDTENVGSGALICTTDKSLKVLSVHENNTYTIEKSKTKGNLYVAYPKSEYLGKTVNTEYKAVGTFEDEEEQTTLFSTGKTISMDDFLQFADTSGDFYYYSKSLYSGKSYDKDKNTIYGRTLEKGNTVQYALATGMATVNHTGISELGKEVKISDTETGKYIGYTFDLYDDMQYARQVNGEYRKLTSDEYNIVSVKIPSVYQVDGQNDTAIQPHQYPVKIYVSTDGTHIVKSDDSLIYSGYIETFEKKVTLPENTTDILISVEQLSEVCCMFFYVDVAYHIDSNNNDEDIDLISGELVNFSALKIYADLLHNQTGRIEKKWIDSNTENPKYTLSQTDIEEFTPEKMELYDNKEFYPNRLLSRVMVEGNPYKDSYTSVTKLSEIKPVQNHFESQLQIGGTFLFVDDDKPDKFSLYTILPKGISLKDCHRTEQLWDLMNLSGMGLNSEILAEHCTAEMITNYRNSGQVYLALHFNFENTDLLPDKTDTVSGISTYSITATLPLSITKGVIRKNPSVVIRSALEFDNTENYKTSTVGVPDNGKWSNDTELFSDINNNGKTDDNLVTSYDYRNKANADYSQFQLQKFVKSDYTGDYVSTEENSVVSYGSDYSYRLELTNGSRQLTNIVLTDILENEPNSQWKGTFQSAELDTDLNGTIYYSEKTDPDNNLFSADWTTEKESSVKAVAVDFGNSVLKSGKTIGVVIHMKAESNSNFKNTFSENKCSLSVVTVEDDSNKFDLISNATKIRLVPALYDIIVTKEDSQTSEKLNGAEFTLYDENNNEVRSLKTNAKGYAIFTDIPNDTVYTLKETKAPKGYESNTNNETVTLDGDYRITVRNERKKGIVKVIKSNSLATDIMVEGAEYSIINEKGDIIANAVTDENGVAVFDNLLWGKYTVKETQSPDGYKLNNKEYTVEINRNNADEPVIVLASDEQSKEITVHLTKYEALTDSTPTETVLPRSTFKLFRLNNGERTGVGKFTTNADGKITVTNIPYGDYVFMETGVPVGYKKCQDIEFTVTKNQEVYHLTAYDNRKTGVIEINNTISNGEPAVGCKFALYSIDTEEKVAVKTTDEDGYICFDNLEWGGYYFLQESVPDYFVLNTQMLSAEIHTPVLQRHFDFVNEVKKGEVLITKTDEIGRNKLQGAKFNLYTKDGTLTKENLITNEDGQIFIDSLEWNTYYLKEIQAPIGYDITESNVHFTISQDTVGSVQEITVTDPLSTDNNSATVTVTAKIKADDVNFANGNPTFIFKLTTDRDVYGKAHTYYRMVTFDEKYVSANTDGNGYVEQNATFSGLPSGKYTATEEESSRYRLNSIQNGIQSVVKDNYAEFDLINNKIGSVTFLNSKYEWGDYSDTQRVADILKKSREYTALKTVWNGDDKIVLGGEINLDDLIVKAIYDDGSTKVIDKSDYTIDTQTIPTASGKYPVTVEYSENGVSHSSVFYINIPRKIIRADRLEVRTTGALSDDNIVGQGDIISPLEFDVSVVTGANKRYPLSAGELVADETQSMTVSKTDGEVIEKTFANADCVKVMINSGNLSKIYGRSNVFYSNKNSSSNTLKTYTVLGDYIKIIAKGNTDITLIPCYLKNSDYTIDVHQAPNIEDETVKVTVTLNSEVFKSEKPLSKTVTLTTDVERAEVYAVGKEIQHFVLGVVYDNTDEVTMTVRGCGDVNAESSTPVSWSDDSNWYNDNFGNFKTTYQKDIASVEIKPSVKPVSMSKWFKEFENLKEPPVIPDTVTDLSYTFYNCYMLESIPKIPESVNNVAYTFYCSKWSGKQASLPENITVDLSRNTIAYAYDMFGGQSMKTATVIFGNANYISYLFDGCQNLETGSIIADDIGTADYVFGYCPNIADVSLQCHNADKISCLVGYAGISNYDNDTYTQSYDGRINHLNIKSTGTVNTLTDIVREYYGLIKEIDIDIHETKSLSYALYSGGSSQNDYVSGREENYCVANVRIGKLTGNYLSCPFGENAYIDELNVVIDKVDPNNTNSISWYDFASENYYLEKFSLSVPEVNNQSAYALYVSNLCRYNNNLKDVSINIDNAVLVDMYDSFYDCIALENIPEMSVNMKTAYGLFEGCTALTEITLDLPSVTNSINWLFNGCTALKTVTLNAENARYSNNVFRNCNSLKTAVVNVSSSEDISYMFQNCTELENLTLNAENATETTDCFKNCPKLTDFSNVYLKDDP